MILFFLLSAFTCISELTYLPVYRASWSHFISISCGQSWSQNFNVNYVFVWLHVPFTSDVPSLQNLDDGSIIWSSYVHHWELHSCRCLLSWGKSFIIPAFIALILSSCMLQKIFIFIYPFLLLSKTWRVEMKSCLWTAHSLTY